MLRHAVVRTDLMSGTDVRPELVSIKYMGSTGDVPTDIDNGHVLKAESLIDEEREIYKGVDVKTDTDISDVVLIASVEVMYDKYKHGLHNFYNEANKICRGYRLHPGDIFSITKEALSGKEEPALGDSVELIDGTSLNVTTEATSGSTSIGSIIDIEKVFPYTYYAILVGGNVVMSGDKIMKVSDGESDPGGISGRSVSDLINDDVKIEWDGIKGVVKGTLNNITEWTEFSSVVSEQTGHFFPVTLDDSYKQKTITVQGSKTTNAIDTEWVLRVDDCKSFTFSCDGKTILTLDFNSATLAK